MRMNRMRLQMLLRDVGAFLIGALIIIMFIGAFILAVWSGTWPILVVAFLCYVAFLLGKRMIGG